jgi:hypothetical protein
MRRTSLPITVVLAFAGAALAGSGCDDRAQTTDAAVVRVSAPADATPESVDATPEDGKVYEGVLEDVRPAWGYLILTVGQGKEARDVRFDMRGARIVGPSGNEWKGQDLWVGDRVLVEMTADGRLVRQISVLPDRKR